MRYCRFLLPGNASPQYGLVETVAGKDRITRLLPPFAEEHWLEPAKDFSPLDMSEVELLSPVAPGKVLCVGRNYREHANELGSDVPKEPLIFLKAVSSLTAPGRPIVIPPAHLTQRVDYEGELAFVMGKRCRDLREGEDVRPYIRGYTCANDVTARDLQKKDGQWARAKGFDTFCPVGPLVSDEIDPFRASVEVSTHLNGELKQRGHSGEFIFAIDAVLRFITAFATLEPGDLVLTGTPAGVSPLKPGDVVEVSIPGVGVLKNPVQ